MSDASQDSREAFEAILTDGGAESYLLRLYVAGLTRQSLEVLGRIKDLCDAHLIGRYELEVVDIRQQPELARDAQIVATPTLLKVRPLPVRILVGDLLRTEEVLRALNITRQAGRDESHG